MGDFLMAARKEKYVIRPFEGLDAADSVLDSVRLFIGADEHEAGSIVVDVETLAEAEFRLSLPSREDLVSALAATPVSGNDSSLVVVASGRTHRVSDILVHEYPVASASHPTSFQLESAPDILTVGDRGGWTLTVAVVLEHKLVTEPLRPSRPGTWLARRDFRVVPERDETSFSPQELTDEVRDLYKLPKSAPTYVLIERDLLLESESVADGVTVYVDRDILRLLQGSQTDAVAQQMQADLAVETLLVVVQNVLLAIRDVTGTEVSTTDVEGYPGVLRLFQRLANQLGVDLHTTLVLASDPQKLSSHLKAVFGLQTLGIKALRGASMGPTEGSNP